MATQPPVKVIEQVSVIKKISIGVVLGLVGIAAAGFFAVIALGSLETNNPEVPVQATMQDCVQLGNYCRKNGNTHSCWSVASACVRYVLRMND